MRHIGCAQIHALLPDDTGVGLEAANHDKDRFSLSGGSLQRQKSPRGCRLVIWT